MASRVAVLFFLGLICFEFATAQVPTDCCKVAVSKLFPLQRIERYTIQDAGKGCDISATVFFTKTGRTVCVSHPDEQDWVKKHIAYLDNKRNKSRTHQ